VVLLGPSTALVCVGVQIYSEVGLTGREAADRQSSSIASTSACASELVSQGFWASSKIGDS